MTNQPTTPEYERFTNAIKHILTVSKDELLKREKAYKRKADRNPRKRGPKRKESSV